MKPSRDLWTETGSSLAVRFSLSLLAGFLAALFTCSAGATGHAPTIVTSPTVHELGCYARDGRHATTFWCEYAAKVSLFCAGDKERVRAKVAHARASYLRAAGEEAAP